MIDRKSPALLTDKIADDDLNHVTGGKLVGNFKWTPGESSTTGPPGLVDKVVTWIKGLLS